MNTSTTTTTTNTFPFKLVFNPIIEDEENTKSALEFEYPEGVKHAYSFFVYPDSLVIHNDLTNEVVEAKQLTNGVYRDLPLDKLMYIDSKKVNSKLFHLYLRCSVELFNYYYAKYKNIRRFKIRIHSDIQCMHKFLMSDAFTIEFSKGMENLFATSGECANLSMRLSLNVVNILWSLLPEDIVDKRSTPYEDSIYRVL